MIDHIGIDVSSHERSKDFYIRALAPLGIEPVVEVSAAVTGTQAYVGMGAEGKPLFWFGAGKTSSNPIHFAFSAQSRAAVDAFFAAAMAAGGIDNGAPGVRAHYHEHYYGAFVIDPDGNNVEAVCHHQPND